MFSIIYASSADHQWSTLELLQLLGKARQNNTALGVSGLLLYKGGNFMQVLEGEQATVLALYERIGHDPRHHGVLTLWQGEGTSQFGDWEMCFQNLDSPEAKETAGYNDFLSLPLNDASFVAAPGRARTLLRAFKATMR